jgi:quinol-cytochrome oxidoreductase complex cytochrome b subunit
MNTEPVPQSQSRARRPSFFEHLHPPFIPNAQMRFTYTWGLGGLSALLFVVLGITGVMEMFYYNPTAEGAGASIRLITYVVPYGWFIRNMHHWSGQAMVVVVALHMARVILTGAYKPHRQLNWGVGVILLALTVALDFTGHALKCDDQSAWAVTTGSGLIRSIPLAGDALYNIAIGGAACTSAALIRLYSWHVLGIALPAAILVGYHFFRVRRDGGIARPSLSSPAPLAKRPPELGEEGESAGGRSGMSPRAELVRKEALFALIAMALLIFVSVFFDAPLGKPADFAPSDVHIQAPWFFLWVQELLRLFSPLIAGVLVPLGVLVLLAILPFIEKRPEGTGIYFAKELRPIHVAFAVLAAVVVGLTVRGGLR